MTGEPERPEGKPGDDDPGAAEAQQPSGEAVWPARRFRMGRGRRVGNAVVGALTRWGLVPHTYILTTRGRRTGQLHRTPVTLVEQNAQWWLVGPYGPVA